MSRISKHQLKPDQLRRLEELFAEAITDSDKSVTAKLFEILSPTERIMVVKRVALLFLVERGVDNETIANRLHLSTSTVYYWSMLMFDTESPVTKSVRKISAKRDIIAFLEDVFAELYIQPGLRRGHWDLHVQDQRRRVKKKTGGL